MSINLIATTSGALAFLASAQAWQQVHVTGDWRIHLFTNNITVSDATVIGDFTEAAWTGYANQMPTWATAALVGGVPTVASPTVTFTQTSGFPSTNYGTYVTDAAVTKLVGAANFLAPVVLTAGQPSYSFQVNVTCKPEF